ncbi:unnamed protein product [Owenia fusiformis]|uniref:Carbohydrate kinase PfkB domain-containing protein n=1 Tax=Owenia fusiformis TaxID=6347 RepID=A0A8S4N323_OWEFU|nr:unnamed protein product [Owenia fusiformis]
MMAWALCRKLPLKKIAHKWKTFGVQASVTNFSNRTLSSDVVKIHPEIQDAITCNKPVVALESTIITHGMPYPTNVDTAKNVEAIIRNNGGIPATIAIISGKIHVGLDESKLDNLANQSDVVKVSRRDLPYVISQSLHGGTTVSATMLIAHICDIPIFVTGGVGGVHKGGQSSMDISADLTELGRTPVTVVSSGVKSILDIGRTLEYLETQGVCVATYGPSKEFPAFFTRSSGFQAPYNVETPASAAKMMLSHAKLGLQNGMLIAVPIPSKHETAGQELEDVINDAVTKAETQGITGKAITPFILQYVNEQTGGESLKANVALIENNADVGSKIAVELSRLKHNVKPNHLNGASYSSKRHYSSDASRKSMNNRPVVIGGSIVDYVARIHQEKFQLNGRTYPGNVMQTCGGVGRNIADCLTRLGTNPLFISAIGTDTHADALKNYCKHMDFAGIAEVPELQTATYCAVIQHHGDLLFGIGDMDTHEYVTPDHIANFKDDIADAPLVVMDGNISVEAMDYICGLCLDYNTPLWFDAADMSKASKPFQSSKAGAIVYTSPNVNELRWMHATVTGTEPGANTYKNTEVIEECLFLCEELVKHIPNIIVTLGEHGVLVCRDTDANNRFPYKGSKRPAVRDHMSAVHYPVGPVNPGDIVSVSGAGDCLNAAMISQIITGIHSPRHCVLSGLIAAHMSLMSHLTVPETINMRALEGNYLLHGCEPIPVLSSLGWKYTIN